MPLSGKRRLRWVSADGGASESGGEPSGHRESPSRSDTKVSTRLRQFVRAVREGDEATFEDVVIRLSRSRRAFAPLALVVGGFVMLFDGLKLLFTNWRLTLVQVLPAMWIWLAMYDLKAHVLHGKTFHVLRGPVLVPIVLVIAAITAASFFLNAVFGFAIVQPGTPQVRPAFAQARSHLRVILASGAVVGVLLGLATTVVTRWGHPWVAISLSVVLGVMMVCYVAVPSRLIGVNPTTSRRDKLTMSAVGGAVGAVICTPPYVLGRVGILMLGSPSLLIPGILVVTVAATLQAGATGAVKTVKMSAKLLAGHPANGRGAGVTGDPKAATDGLATGHQETAVSASQPDTRHAG